MEKVLLGLLLIVAFYGCATAPNLNGISLGMTKPEVIRTLGNPAFVSAKDNVEFLRYTCSFGYLTIECNELNQGYFVRLVNGKVESYGKVGDFNSTKDQVNVIKLETQK